MSREQDRIFIRNFIGVIATLFAVAIVFIVVATSLYHGDEKAQEKLARIRAERNLKPVSEVHLTGQPMPKIAQASGGGNGGGGNNNKPRSGEEVVQQVCSACHAGHFMNAPQIGNKDEWKPRLSQGFDKLVHAAEKGFGNMPPQGGQVSEDEIKAAIKYMVEDKTGLTLPK